MSSTNTQPNPLDACNPRFNATVSASAGSGKTWLLITRIIRLLIDGAQPGNIIALTFTRKAAAEMQVRLNQRLYELATADDKELGELLQQIGCDSDTVTKTLAGGLYDKLMHSLYPVRIQTFHSFCQDILSRFPLEADIPPGFELLEDTSMLERQAWQTLFNNAGLNTKSTLNQELDFIMQVCNGPDNTLTALSNFLAHRSDWWAYTAHTQKPIAFARDALTQFLQIDQAFIDGKQDPISVFLNEHNTQKLTVFANLLLENKNISSEKHATSINQALKQTQKQETDKPLTFALISSAFLKKDGDILVQGRKYTATLEKKLGTENAERFIELHEYLAGKIQNTNEQLKRLLTLKINHAWYYAGCHYVEIFQRLKKEMRLLDFTDLEWKCYQLLHHADNAQWVQYKIDQRIDHLLIDEFQDTNPTQWQLLSPILEEIAADPSPRSSGSGEAPPRQHLASGFTTQACPRSVFLVGDEKQSIYSFRRANPALQAQASLWLAQNLSARATPLDFSRRSSPAIIHCVNQVFEQDAVQAIMTSYTTHDTHLGTLPGRVQLCELFTEDEQADAEETALVSFRNPLTQPREIIVTTPRHKEADYIARQVFQLIDKPALITDDGSIRPAKYGDVLILMRTRTHIDIYEKALKQYNIPFIGNKKGGLLDCLEVQDLTCLLNTLITPYNNLALAQVLKSPIFNACDNDLTRLAQQKHSPHWYERLLLLATNSTQKADSLSNSPSLSKPLRRAAKLLPRWQKLAEQLPIHDCLDKIFSEGNIIQRYVAVNKTENKQKVAANCQRFLELSLETNSGRYPSITRFLQQLKHLKSFSSSPPQEPLTQGNVSRVRLMTIHGSKGLEAPIVFLADCNNTTVNRNAYASLVRWPANNSRPVNFQLQLSKQNTDQMTQKLQQEKLDEQAREELNLLYVALTRAREQIFISGTGNRRSANKQNQANSWYQIIKNGLTNSPEVAPENDLNRTSDGLKNDLAETTSDCTDYKTIQHLSYDASNVNQLSKAKTPASVPFVCDQRLLSPMKTITESSFMIAPSLDTNEHQQNHTHEQSRDKATTLETTLDMEHDATKWRGSIIHRILEQFCKTNTYPAAEQTISEIQQQLKAETALNKPAFISSLDTCMEEAMAVFHHPELDHIFNPAADKQTYNEMPLMYLQSRQAVYGIIDRLIKSDKEIWIIDYKTQQQWQRNTPITNQKADPSAQARQAAMAFSKQLNYYREGVKKLWPKHSVKTGILFTHHKEMVWLK